MYKIHLFTTICTLVFSFFFGNTGVYAQEPVQPLPAFPSPLPSEQSSYFKAQVIEILKEETTEESGIKRQIQVLRIQILSGEEQQKEAIVRHGGTFLASTNYKLAVGDQVIVQKVQTAEGITYYLTDRYRLHSLLVIFGVFVVLAGFFGRVKGITSLFGMLVSIGVLTFVLIPGILAGREPIIMSVISAGLIAVASLYLAHGFNKQTTVALISTLITLGLATVMAVTFVFFSKLTGGGTEEALFLQSGQSSSLNLQGLLLGGIIIGALGVLDDITTAQVSLVYELHVTNTRLTAKELYKKGLIVGREHIASLVNTLLLAYASASLPLFILFYIHTAEPLWVTLNSEYIAEEIVRTLVGSSALILAVPISTYLAAHTIGTRIDKSS